MRGDTSVTLRVAMDKRGSEGEKKWLRISSGQKFSRKSFHKCERGLYIKSVGQDALFTQTREKIFTTDPGLTPGHVPHREPSWVAPQFMNINEVETAIPIASRYQWFSLSSRSTFHERGVIFYNKAPFTLKMPYIPG